MENTTVPEDYVQHVILGVRISSSNSTHLTSPFSLRWCLSYVKFLPLGSSSPLTGDSFRVTGSRPETQGFRESLHWCGGYQSGCHLGCDWGAFFLRSEPVIHPYADYSGTAPSENPFDAVDPAPAIGHPLGYDVAAAPGYKPVDHIEAALHQMQIGIDPVTPSQGLDPLWFPKDPANPPSRTEVKTTVARQRRAACGLLACVSLTEATVAYPVSKEKMSTTGIPHKYLSKQLTVLSPNDSLYTCTFEGCDRIFKQLAGAYNHLFLHLRVAVGCYYCSGHWWTSKGWSDHHVREHPQSNPYPSGATLEWLLVKKAQAHTMASSEAASTTSHSDDPLEDETQSATSLKDDKEEDYVPSFPLFSLGSALMVAPSTEITWSSPGNFGGACPHVPIAAAGLGHCKKALPHHSTRAWTFCMFSFWLYLFKFLADNACHRYISFVFNKLLIHVESQHGVCMTYSS